MVTRKRVNLSLSERDFERLAGIAADEGKTPSTLVADMVKAGLWGASIRPSKASRKPQGPLKRVPEGVGAPKPGKSPVGAPELSRQQRRALDRAKSKGGR